MLAKENEMLAGGGGKPQVEIVDGRAVTTSMAVAEFFGKRHDHVLEAIRKLIADCPEDLHLPNFREVSRDVPGNNGIIRKMPMYLLTKTGFMLLSMGFTGDKAKRWKFAYVKGFEDMEAALRARENGAEKKEAAAVEQVPSFVEIDGSLVATTSLSLAEAFGRPHAQVVQRIHTIIATGPEGIRGEFAPYEFAGAHGRAQAAYAMTRKAFALLALGFSGGGALSKKVGLLDSLMPSSRHAAAPVAVPALLEEKPVERSTLAFNGSLVRILKEGGMLWVSCADTLNATGMEGALLRQAGSIPPELVREDGGEHFLALPAVIRLCRQDRKGVAFLEWLSRVSGGVPDGGKPRAKAGSAGDLMMEFVAECLEPDPAGCVPVSVVYLQYRAWCRERGMEPMNTKRFRYEMAMRAHADIEMKSNSKSYFVVGYRMERLSSERNTQLDKTTPKTAMAALRISLEKIAEDMSGRVTAQKINKALATACERNGWEKQVAAAFPPTDREGRRRHFRDYLIVNSVACRQEALAVLGDMLGE